MTKTASADVGGSESSSPDEESIAGIGDDCSPSSSASTSLCFLDFCFLLCFLLSPPLALGAVGVKLELEPMGALLTFFFGAISDKYGQKQKISKGVVEGIY